MSTEAPADLVCPECGTCSIDLAPSPQGDEHQGHPVGTCRRCGRRYDATVLPTYQQRYEDLVVKVRREECPACGGGKRTVRSLCDRTARECFFVITCEGCGDVRLARRDGPRQLAGFRYLCTNRWMK